MSKRILVYNQNLRVLKKKIDFLFSLIRYSAVMIKKQEFNFEYNVLDNLHNTGSFNNEVKFMIYKYSVVE